MDLLGYFSLFADTSFDLHWLLTISKVVWQIYRMAYIAWGNGIFPGLGMDGGVFMIFLLGLRGAGFKCPALSQTS